ncbi:sigma-E factor negative regulatory protein [Aromatoleum aromaticum]|nr:sigma-E factor negative regulatory protein [Aromatoleum aromaticum]NMG53897.1 anti-sigma 24 factor [Aromatoleum aromaticum]
MKDKLSALLDGDLDEQAMSPVFDSIRRDRSLRSDWETYCLIGDVLRGDRNTSPGLVARVMAGIEAEPTVLAPPASGSASAPPGAAQPRAGRSLMPLAASIMGVAVVGWVAYTLNAEPEGDVRTASAASGLQAVEKVSVPGGATAPSPQVDRQREYLFAHQAMTSGGPLSGVIQHVRTVSDVRQDVNR